MGDFILNGAGSKKDTTRMRVNEMTSGLRIYIEEEGIDDKEISFC